MRACLHPQPCPGAPLAAPHALRPSLRQLGRRHACSAVSRRAGDGMRMCRGGRGWREAWASFILRGSLWRGRSREAPASASQPASMAARNPVPVQRVGACAWRPTEESDCDCPAVDHSYSVVTQHAHGYVCAHGACMVHVAHAWCMASHGTWHYGGTHGTYGCAHDKCMSGTRRY